MSAYNNRIVAARHRDIFSIAAFRCRLPIRVKNNSSNIVLPHGSCSCTAAAAGLCEDLQRRKSQAGTGPEPFYRDGPFLENVSQLSAR